MIKLCEFFIRIISIFQPVSYYYFRKHLNSKTYWLRLFTMAEYYKYTNKRIKFLICAIKLILCEPLEKQIYDLHGESLFKILYTACINEKIIKFQLIRVHCLYNWFVTFHKFMSKSFIEKNIIIVYNCSVMLGDNYISVIYQLLEKRFNNDDDFLNKIKAKILLNKLKE